MSRSQRLTIIATILGSTVVFLDATVVNVALPAISDDLDTGLADQQWVVEAYLLALVSLLLVGGSLADQFGRRRMFVLGLVGFGITSALCAIAPNSEIADRRPRGAGAHRSAAGSRVAGDPRGDVRGRRRAARRWERGPHGPGSRPCSGRRAGER